MKKRSRSRERRRRQTEVAQELELMPMLNVFISIIPLLLLSAAFVQLAVIPTALPAQAAASQPATSAETATTALTIVVHADAYTIVVDGVTVSTIARPAPAADPDAAKGARAQLGQALSAIAAQHPGQREVKIAAEPRTRYEDIIDVMDVSRGAGLPEAALADEQGA